MRINIDKEGKTTLELEGLEAGFLASALALVGSTTNLLEVSEELKHIYEMLTLNFQYSTETDWEKVAVEELIQRKQKADNIIQETWDKLKSLKDDAGLSDDLDEEPDNHKDEKFDA